MRANAVALATAEHWSLGLTGAGTERVPDRERWTAAAPFCRGDSYFPVTPV